MKKPIVGVLPLYDEQRESLWMLPGYLNCLQRAGALPMVLPQRMDPADLEQILTLCDGFLFTGGHDINPSLYGEQPNSECGIWNEERDILEMELFRRAYACDIPMFGICRGIQFVNVALGGTLYQDIPTQYGRETEHHMDPPYDRICHRVVLTKGTPLRRLLGCETMGVNSYHHQAIKQLAPSLHAMARSEDGLVEAVYAPQQSFLWAVQWHPEFSYCTDPHAMKVVAAFTDACKKKADLL